MAKSKSRPQTTENKETKTETKVEEKESTSTKSKTELTNEQIDKAMANPIDVKFAHSDLVKFAALSRKMSCEQIYREFVGNPKAFIAITNNKDFKSIKDLMKNPNVTYRGNVITDKLKEAFILWLTKSTNYANERLKKSNV